MRSIMKLRKKQKGLTLVGALMVMSILGFLFYVGIRVGPVYQRILFCSKSYGCSSFRAWCGE